MREWKVARHNMPISADRAIPFVIIDATGENLNDFDACFQIINNFEKAFKLKAALLEPRSMTIFADPEIKSRLARSIVPGRLRWKPASL